MVLVKKENLSTAQGHLRVIKLCPKQMHITLLLCIYSNPSDKTCDVSSLGIPINHTGQKVSPF